MIASFFKCAAICSSIFLASGLVCYRAGGLNWLIQEETQKAVPVSTHQPAEEFTPPGKTPIDPKTVGLTPGRPIMSSSKMAEIFPIEPGKEGSLVPVPDIMYSSKSGPIILPKQIMGEDKKLEARMGRMAEMIMPHPTIDEKQKYFDVKDAGQILVVFKVGIKVPEKGKDVELKGTSKTINLGGRPETKSSYTNILMTVESWKYLDNKPPAKPAQSQQATPSK